MTELGKSVLGRTGLEVTKLGFGAMELRTTASPLGREITPERADEVLNAVLDAGINFIDTAPDYSDSEDLIGRFLSQRRDEYFLASKCGCVVGAVTGFQHVFTRENVRAGVEQSLRRMRTDHLDLVQLHASPSRRTLEESGVLEELEDCRREGKVRYVGISATLPHIVDHVAMGVFDTFQVPYSGLEREHEQILTEAAGAGAGVIVRGGVAKGVPDPEQAMAKVPAAMRDENQARFAGIHEQWTRRRDRLEGADLDDLLDGASTIEFLLRFTISHPDLDTTIVGTQNPDHLRANVEAARKGPLPADVYAEAKRRLAADAGGED